MCEVYTINSRRTRVYRYICSNKNYRPKDNREVLAIVNTNDTGLLLTIRIYYEQMCCRRMKLKYIGEDDSSDDSEREALLRELQTSY